MPSAAPSSVTPRMRSIVKIMQGNTAVKYTTYWNRNSYVYFNGLKHSYFQLDRTRAQSISIFLPSPKPFQKRNWAIIFVQFSQKSIMKANPLVNECRFQYNKMPPAQMRQETKLQDIVAQCIASRTSKIGHSVILGPYSLVKCAISLILVQRAKPDSTCVRTGKFTVGSHYHNMYTYNCRQYKAPCIVNPCMSCRVQYDMGSFRILPFPST